MPDETLAEQGITVEQAICDRLMCEPTKFVIAELEFVHGEISVKLQLEDDLLLPIQGLLKGDSFISPEIYDPKNIERFLRTLRVYSPLHCDSSPHTILNGGGSIRFVTTEQSCVTS